MHSHAWFSCLQTKASTVKQAKVSFPLVQATFSLPARPSDQAMRGFSHADHAIYMVSPVCKPPFLRCVRLRPRIFYHGPFTSRCFLLFCFPSVMLAPRHSLTLGNPRLSSPFPLLGCHTSLLRLRPLHLWLSHNPLPIFSLC